MRVCVCVCLHWCSCLVWRLANPLTLTHLFHHLSARHVHAAPKALLEREDSGEDGLSTPPQAAAPAAAGRKQQVLSPTATATTTATMTPSAKRSSAAAATSPAKRSKPQEHLINDDDDDDDNNGDGGAGGSDNGEHDNVNDDDGDNGSDDDDVMMVMVEDVCTAGDKTQHDVAGDAQQDTSAVWCVLKTWSFVSDWLCTRVCTSTHFTCCFAFACLGLTSAPRCFRWQW